MAEKPLPGLRRRSVADSAQAGSAFTLLEVVVAIGIVSFAIISLLGLIPVGLKSNNDSMEESQATNLLHALVADRQATDCSTTSYIYNLPALTTITKQVSGVLYTTEDLTLTNQSAARYCVSYTIYPPSALYPGATNNPATTLPMPVSIDFQVSWPAMQTNRASLETLATFMQP